jgi:class 3 adenylate cyclase/tetratricopeptide (TPR) repeat protein
MKCPQCQNENPDGSKFCGECGVQFERICPTCSSVNPPRSKFCGECGHQFPLPGKPAPQELSFDDKLRKIQKYLPSGLAKKILAQKGKIEGERRRVTVMFCDMEGFTPLTERLGHEEAYALVDQVFEILVHKVHEYEGMVNKMTGDGIMALFGAPIALEDAPQRAIRSAYAIHREMAGFSDRLKQEKGLQPIKMRIGLHTGPVVVGTLGNDLRVEFTAIGDTVNLASRMEGLAEPGATYVTEETFRLTEGLFRFEALGEKEVKGKETPVNVYRVIAPSTRRTRFDVSAERGLTPFLGRGRELELLLDGYERASAGRGQAFFIVSDAGVGKSRLLYEFRKAVANDDVTFLEGRCLSYSRGTAYHPIIDILKSNFDVREGDEDSSIREKVVEGLKILGVYETSILPYILELLAVKNSGIDSILISPEGKKTQIIEALKRISLKGSEIRPLIMAVEDLHWIDNSSEELFKNIIDSIPGARVLLIFTYRPEFVYTWGPKSFFNHLNLNRLSNREVLAMTNHLLGAENIDKDLEDLILEKTEGVPFFIEEFVKSLIDLKIIERNGNGYHLAKDSKAMTIPSTIQDVIMARVDLFPAVAKEVLQGGAVIEREFNYELIREVMNLPEKELLSQLSILKNSELLYERGITPQSTYIFKHSLTREVVYDSILTKKKKGLHEQIGMAIEKVYEDRIDEHYGVLAEHFIASDNYEKGSNYSKLAARKALKAGSFKEAIAHSQKRVLCLESCLSAEDNQQKIIDARTALAGYYLGLNQHVEAKEAVSPIVDSAIGMNDQKNLCGIYTTLGSYYGFVKEEYSQGVEYLTKGNIISGKERNFFYNWLSGYFLGTILFWYGGEFEKGLDYFKRSLDLSEKVNSLALVAFVKGTMSANIYMFRGMIDLAYKTSEEAVFAAKESGDTHTLGMAYACHGAACYCKGLFDEAESNFSHAIRICEKTGQYIWEGWSTGWLGLMYFELGQYAKSLEYHEKTVSLATPQRYFPSFITFDRLCLERAKVKNKNYEIDLSELPSKYLLKNKVKIIEGSITRHIGEIFMNVGDQYLAEAEEWIKKAIKVDEKNCTFWYLGADHALYSDVFKRKGDILGAKDQLGKAVAIFKECGADGWVSKYEKELTMLA